LSFNLSYLVYIDNKLVVFVYRLRVSRFFTRRREHTEC
jgi:hypothetical protein